MLLSAACFQHTPERPRGCSKNKLFFAKVPSRSKSFRATEKARAGNLSLSEGACSADFDAYLDYLKRNINNQITTKSRGEEEERSTSFAIFI